MKYFKEFTKSDKLVFKFYVLVVILLIISLLVGCKATKTSETNITKDSISNNEKYEVTPHSEHLATILEPCNEDGTLKPLHYQSSSNGKTTTISDNNGAIVINEEQKIDTTFIEKTVYRDKLVYKDKIVEIPVKNPLNKYFLIYGIVATIYILRKPIFTLVKKLINPLA